MRNEDEVTVVRPGGLKVTFDLKAKVAELLTEDLEMRSKLSKEGKRYDPDLPTALAVKCFNTRLLPRWEPSHASSGQVVRMQEVCGLTVYPDVTDPSSYDSVMNGRTPDYIKKYGVRK